MKYRNKLELHGSKQVKNKLGENTKEFGYIKDIYCQITPSHGGIKDMGGTGITEAYTMQRIFVRKLSIKKPEIDMYFKDKITGVKYEVQDFFPNYKNNDEWEFRTRIDYE